jgi:hypothetical protein
MGGKIVRALQEPVAGRGKEGTGHAGPPSSGALGFGTLVYKLMWSRKSRRMVLDRSWRKVTAVLKMGMNANPMGTGTALGAGGEMVRKLACHRGTLVVPCGRVPGVLSCSLW